MHDPRLGRFFAVDPLTAKYPHNSPYAFSENRVIDGVELEGLEISLHGSNGKSITFEHPDLPKKSFEIDYPIKENTTITFPKLPDAIGYNLEFSLNATGGSASASGRFGKSYVIFTVGNYKYQPFPYLYGGATAGPNLVPSPGEGRATVGLSLFAANFTGSDEDVVPSTWTKGFAQTSYNVGGFFKFGLSGGKTGFTSFPFDNSKGGWIGTSIDISGGIGGGYHASAESGITYYTLTELKVSTTNELMSSRIGRTRMILKWLDFGTGGMIPGTPASDVLKTYQDRISGGTNNNINFYRQRIMQ